MIVGTAGHIDHGKSTLVRALTGIDPDRLPEEKRRGISIELGYAFTELDGQRLAFIDVPGHERLVATMLAGATGMDAALLLVAADDGPMPQTHEHLAVLSLLGIRQGLAVITKCDRVDAARQAEVQAQTRALLARTPLAGAPVLAVSATSGEGLDALRSALRTLAAQCPARPPAPTEEARLAVDRAFVLDGVGVVATGTLHAGAIAVGDELVLVPGGARTRVRSLRAQDRAVARAEAGQRVALGLHGLAKDQLPRGAWLVAPACAQSSTRLDARIELGWHAARPLRSGQPVTLHLGAEAVPASVVLLDRELLPPGEQALVQLIPHRALGAWHGDRLVLRDASGQHTLAGGVVLDPQAPGRYRRTPQRLAWLAAQQVAEPTARVQALLAAAPLGVDWSALQAAQGRALPLPPNALQAKGWALDVEHREPLGEQLLQALARYHRQQPEELGPDAARLRRLAAPRLPELLFRALLQDLTETGRLSQRGHACHLPEHGVQLSAAEQRIAQKVAPHLVQAGFEGAWVRDLARDCGEPEALLRTTLARLAQQGELQQVVKDLYYPLATMRTLAHLARQCAEQSDGTVLAAQYRDATGLGRKRAIQILECFDRVGLLRRVGDTHRLRVESEVFA